METFFTILVYFYLVGELLWLVLFVLLWAHDMKIFTKNPYVNGIVGQEFKLSLWQRIRILFCRKLIIELKHGME